MFTMLKHNKFSNLLLTLLTLNLNSKLCYLYIVLDKTLKGIRGVRPDNRKVLRAPGPRTKYFERLFYCSINYNNT